MAAVAKKDMATVNHLKLAIGLNTISNLTMMVGDLEMWVLFLQDLLKGLGDLMIGIVNGIIPVAIHPERTGTWTTCMVTRADFDGYKAEQKRMLSVLEQLIGGVYYWISYVYHIG